MSYEKALKIVENYERKRFLKGKYSDSDGDVCVIGLLFPSTRQVAGNSPDGVPCIDRLINNKIYIALEQELADLGLTVEQAKKLQIVNDLNGINPEDRYNFVLRWLKGKP